MLAAISATGLALDDVRRGPGQRPRPIAWLVLGVGVVALGWAAIQLGQALLDDDFSLAYVADFSRRGATRPYRLAALWGGMAGSLLLFTTIAGAVGWLAAARLRGQPAAAVLVATTGGLVAALTAALLAFADPFERLDLAPIDGGGMPPILEHPAMLYHPPLLYLGLASLTGPFALSVAGLVGRAGDDWAARARLWLLVPWTVLAVGMVAGAHWAYVELGWGGYWAWDPVENTALLPWLAVTLALHAGLRSPGGRSLAAFSCVAFLLGLTGTMLTRSGAVPSVHAFAEDPAIGRALAALVAVVAVGVVALFVRTRHDAANLPPTPEIETGVPLIGAPVSQFRSWGQVRNLLLGHQVVVGSLLAIVLVGTIAPLWSDLVGGETIAIEGRYFASFAGPLAVVGLALVATVPMVLRARVDARTLAPVALGAVLGGAVLAVAGGHVRLPQLVLGCLAGAACVSAGAAAAAGGTRRGPHVAHAGLGLLLLGIAGTATGRTESEPLEPGETIEVLGQRVTYRGVYVDDGQDDGTSAVVAEVEVGDEVRRPALVAYPNLRRLLPETSLVSTPWRDVQVGLVDASDAGIAVIRVSVHPLQVWVWWGGIMIVIGGVATAWGRRRR